jgi:hypothetical protein
VAPFLKQLLSWIRQRKGLPIQPVEMDDVDVEKLEKQLELEEAEEAAQIEEEAAHDTVDRSLLLRRMLGIQNPSAPPISAQVSAQASEMSNVNDEDSKTKGQRLLNLLLDAKLETMQRPAPSFASAPSAPDYIPKHKSILLKQRSTTKDVNKEKQASFLALLKGDSKVEVPLVSQEKTLPQRSAPPPQITTSQMDASKPEPIPLRTPQRTESTGSLESSNSMMTTPGGTPPWLPPRPHAPAPPFTPTTPVFGLSVSPSKRSISPKGRSRSGSNVLGTSIRVYGEKRGEREEKDDDDDFKFRMDEIMGAF